MDIPLAFSAKHPLRPSGVPRTFLFLFGYARIARDESAPQLRPAALSKTELIFVRVRRFWRQQKTTFTTYAARGAVLVHTADII